MGLFNRKPKEPTITFSGEYFASHPAVKGHYKPLELTMTDAGVEVAAGKKADRKTLHAFTWEDIISFEAEHETETMGGGQRITATRMVTLGVFSLAAPKATGKVTTKFVSILHTTTGDIVLEEMLDYDAGSKLGSMTSDILKRVRQGVRSFVAERARGQQY